MIRRIDTALHRMRTEQGSALIEFTFIGVTLMVPLAYIVLAVFQIQSASYAVASASREAGRAFVTSNSSDQAMDRANLAARLALENHRLELDPSDMKITCTVDPCLSPGGRVEVSLKVTVRLPLVPKVLAGGAPASVTVSSDHQETVDDWR